MPDAAREGKLEVEGAGPVSTLLLRPPLARARLPGLPPAPRRPPRERAARPPGPGARLFLQGTRDRLADPDLLLPVCEELGAKAAVHVVPDADHGFHVPKRSGRTDNDVREELTPISATLRSG